MKAKTPEEEVGPLADPEPDDAWPPVKEPHDDEVEPPDKKAARSELPIITPKPHPVVKEIIETRLGVNHIEMSGPHHS